MSEAAVSKGPIVLLGAARSGTKFLRDVLSGSAQIAAVPYDVAYIWHYGREGVPHDLFIRADATETLKRRTPAQLRKAAGMGADDSRRLLEKTVGNTLRVGFVDEILPGAQFIHLVRDGRAVTESAMRQWRMPADWRSSMGKLKDTLASNPRYALWFGRNFVSGMLSGRKGGKVWGPRYEGIEEDAATRPLEEVCARQWAESVRHARKQLAGIPPDRTHTVRYEDLLEEDGTFDALTGFLGLEDGAAVKMRFRARARRDELDKWREALTEAQIAAIIAIAEPELAAFGYLQPGETPLAT